MDWFNSIGRTPVYVTAHIGSSVHRSISEETGKLHAVEIVPKDSVVHGMLEAGHFAVQVSRSIAEQYVPNLRHVLLYHHVAELDTNLYMASEYISGQSLASLITELGHQAPHNPLDLRIARAYTWQLLQGLKQLHECGCCHGALSASTARFGRHGDLRLTDWWWTGKGVGRQEDRLEPPSQEDEIRSLVAILTGQSLLERTQAGPCLSGDCAVGGQDQGPEMSRCPFVVKSDACTGNAAKTEDYFRLGLVVLDMVVGVQGSVPGDTHRDSAVTTDPREAFPQSFPSGHFLSRIAAAAAFSAQGAMEKTAELSSTERSEVSIDDRAAVDQSGSQQESSGHLSTPSHSFDSTERRRPHEPTPHAADWHARRTRLAQVVKAELAAATEVAAQRVAPGNVKSLRKSTVWRFIEACLLGSVGDEDEGGDKGGEGRGGGGAEAAPAATLEKVKQGDHSERNYRPAVPLARSMDASHLLQHRFLAPFLGRSSSSARSSASSNSSSDRPRLASKSSSSSSFCSNPSSSSSSSSFSSMSSSGGGGESSGASSSDLNFFWDLTALSDGSSSSAVAEPSVSSGDTTNSARGGDRRRKSQRRGEEEGIFRGALPPTALASHHGGGSLGAGEAPRRGGNNARPPGKKLEGQSKSSRTLAQRKFLRHHSKGQPRAAEIKEDPDRT